LDRRRQLYFSYYLKEEILERDFKILDKPALVAAYSFVPHICSIKIESSRFYNFVA